MLAVGVEASASNQVKPTAAKPATLSAYSATLPQRRPIAVHSGIETIDTPFDTAPSSANVRSSPPSTARTKYSIEAALAARPTSCSSFAPSSHAKARLPATAANMVASE